MAILSTFVFSENSNQVPNPNGQGTALHIINPQNVFRPIFVPGAFSFSLTFGIIELDTDEPHTMQFTLTYTETNEIAIDTGEFNLPVNPNKDPRIPKNALGFMMNLDFRNVPFKHEGKYEAKLFLDKKILETKPIYVYSQERM